MGHDFQTAWEIAVYAAKVGCVVVVVLASIVWLDPNER